MSQPIRSYSGPGRELTIKYGPSASTLSAAAMKSARTQVHAATSVWNLAIASRPSAEQVVDTELGSNGQSFASNLAKQAAYNNVTATDGVLGYYAPGYGVSVNEDRYSMPVYVVPAGQPTTPVWWSTWDIPWQHVGRTVNGDLEGQFLAVPLPTLSDMKPGTNGMKFSRAAAQGATTVYSTEQMWGAHSFGGSTFTVTACARVGTTSEFQLTISPGLAAAATINATTTRPRQMESNGDDKSLIVLQPQASGAIKLWEFWGFRPDGAAPGGYSFANAGYVADARNWDGIYPYTWGMRAVSMSAIGGAITLDDLQRGTITHALNIAVPVTGTVNGKSYDSPATRWDGANHTGVASVTDAGDPGRHRVRVGGYFRLPASGWSDAQIDTLLAGKSMTTGERAKSKMAYRAARDYGIYITDTSGAVSFYTEGVQSLDTPYSPYTTADLNAHLADLYAFTKVPEFWAGLVRLVPKPLPPLTGTDTFTRTASTTTMGNFPSGPAYVAEVGTWGITSDGKAYSVTAADGDLVSLEIGTANWDMSCAATVITDGYWDMLAAYGSTGDCFQLEVGPNGALYLVRKVGGVSTSLVTLAAGTVADGDTVRWNRTSAGVLTVWVNGVQKHQSTGQTQLAFTKVALRQGGTAALRWDNLTFA